MKKIMFLLLCLLSIKVVSAEEKEMTFVVNLMGIEGKFGDAVFNASYGLYQDDEYVMDLVSNNKYSLEIDGYYTIKEKEESVGFKYYGNHLFRMTKYDEIIKVDKYVISKNIHIDILNDYEYYIYLKSDNSLYKTINKDTGDFLLPYGVYYITDNEDYYEEFEVLKEGNLDIVIDVIKEDNNKEDTPSNDDKLDIPDNDDKENTSVSDKENNDEDNIVSDDNIDDNLDEPEIDNKEDNTNNEENDVVDTPAKDNENKNNEIKENIKEELPGDVLEEDKDNFEEEIIEEEIDIKNEDIIIENSDKNIDDNNISNPKTLDNIYSYVILLGINLILILVGGILIIKNKNKF